MSTPLRIGVDLGATRLKMALVNDKAMLFQRSEIDTPFNAKRTEIIDLIVANIKAMLKETPIKKEDVLGMGIGAPGPIDFDRGIVHYFPNIKGWNNVPLKKILQKRLGLNVVCDNDVNAMALAEYRFGAGKGVSNLVCLTLGTGVGGGIVINGKIYRGSTMSAGEIGHIPINERGPRCNCGGMACLERYIGNRYILYKIKKIFGKNIPLNDLSLIAKKGNRKALMIWEDVGRKLGVTLTGIVNLLNPDLIVVGGGLSKAGELILRPLREEIKSRAMRDQASHVKIVRAKLGDNAGIIGAAFLL